MPFQPPPKSVVVVRAVPLPVEMQHELALLQENALITPEAAKALTVASANLGIMKRVSTGVGQRHFNKIDTLLAVRKPTPVSEAREVLATMNGTWENLAGDFHKYRKLHYQAKLMRAKLNKTKNAVLADLAEITSDDRDIAEAQAALDQASIDEIEAEVAKGHGALKIALEQATAASTKYQAICHAAGKESFTEDDFLADECDYYLKSAFWHVSKNFTEVAGAGWTRAKASEEIRLYLEGMGVSWLMVQGELKNLQMTAGGVHDAHPGRDNETEVKARFNQWLDRVTEKYRGGALAALKQHGPGRLKRIAALLNPDGKADMKGPVGVTTLDRGSYEE